MVREVSHSRGCEQCTLAAAQGSWPPPRRVALRSATTFLHVCDSCGAYWEHENQKLTRISDEDAQRNYPAYFQSRHSGSTP